jgi:transcription elongation factor Elf1
MESQSAKLQPSFYCNRCDKWVDGIEDKQNSPDPREIIQVLCDECGGAIRYRVPSLWKKLQRRASRFFGSAFSARSR